MKKPESMKLVYFLGIGGIGMSALARYLHLAGVKVMGYDKTQTTLTKELEAEGIEVHYDDKPELITKEIDLIVYTPAIPKDLKEFEKSTSIGVPLLKRSELLEVITQNNITLAVAGTHGKTTVSTLLAHILYTSAAGCTAFLGGISKNYNSNLLLSRNSNFIVTEADEFDRSFLRLHPYLEIITSTDPDHLDIYNTHDSLLGSFSDFASNIKDGGILLIKKEAYLPIDSKLKAKIYTYSMNSEADFYITELNLHNGIYSYNLNTPSGIIKGFSPMLPGLFNVENSVAASAAAYLSNIPEETIVSAVNSFTGVKRRFDHRIMRDDIIFIDDYAHHPEELKACISSVKKLYPEKEITGIFQPHLFTRTRDFATGFAEALSLLNYLVLLDIYPAREKPIEGITSKMLLDLVPMDNKILLNKPEIINYLELNKPEVLLTLGAGDIDQIVPVIEDYYNNLDENELIEE